MENDNTGNLSASGRALLKMLKGVINQLVAGECSDEEIDDTIRRLNPDMKGYKCEDDYVTIDEGMKIMHYGKNRAGFCNLMKKYGINNETFKNVKIGYSRRKIIALKHSLDEEYSNRKMREERLRKRAESMASEYDD